MLFMRPIIDMDHRNGIFERVSAVRLVWIGIVTMELILGIYITYHYDYFTSILTGLLLLCMAALLILTACVGLVIGAPQGPSSEVKHVDYLMPEVQPKVVSTVEHQ